MASASGYDQYYPTEDPPEEITGSHFKKHWNKKRNYSEILFPARHVPHLPWKGLKWEESGPSSSLPYQNVKATITGLYHATHKKEFAAICEENPDAYTLKPKKKTGKSGYKTFDGSPFGHSFVACNPDESPNEESRYRYVKPGENLLPGSYIWWSVDLKLKHNYCPSGYRVSYPFVKPPESPYGSKIIHGSIKYVLEAYQKSFPPDDANKLPRIELRIGGTQHYKFERCHDIIVCACYNGKEPPLPLDRYPLWNEGKIIHHHESGAVLWVNPLEITIRNGIKCHDHRRYSWDNFTFAFNYPDDQHKMICPKKNEKQRRLFTDRDVRHDTSTCKCIKTKPGSDSDRKFVCPDKEGLRRSKRKSDCGNDDDFDMLSTQRKQAKETIEDFEVT